MTTKESERDQPTIIVRGVDKKTYIEARKAALDRGITIGKWINEAIAEKLRADRGAWPVDSSSAPSPCGR